MGKHVNTNLRETKLVRINEKQYIFDIDKELKRHNFQKILSFYLFKIPVKDVSSLSIEFSDYGWNKYNYRKLLTLMKESLIATLPKSKSKLAKDNILFYPLKSSDDVEMVLNSVKEENSSAYIIFKLTSTSKLESIFRHIRNSFAHGNFYIDSKRNYHLEDYYHDKYTSKILLNEKTLLSWIDVITKGPINKKIL